MSKGNNKTSPKTSKIVTALKKMEGKPKKRDIIEFSDSDDDSDDIKDSVKDAQIEKKDDVKDEIKQSAQIKASKDEDTPISNLDIKSSKEDIKIAIDALKDSNISDEDRAILKQIIKQNNEILQQLTIDRAEKETKRQVKEQKRLLALEEQKRQKELEKIELQKLVLQREHDIRTTMNNNFNAQLIRTRRGLLN